MCGHFGIVNREKSIIDSNKMIKIFNQGLYCNSVRGQHGTGICAISEKGEIRTYKRALNSSDFIELSTAKKIIEDTNNIILMGHNRHATLGSHTDNNTHPFVNENITLFHNGTLNSHAKLNPGKSFSVDSDAISYLLSNTTNPKDALEKLDGAYALTWYNDQLETLNFARNNERTFYIAYTPSGSIIYSSEQGLIEWLAERNGIKIKEIDALSSGKHISIPLDIKNSIEVNEFTPLIKPENDYRNYYTSKPKIPFISGVTATDIAIVTGEEWCNYSNSTERKPKTFGFIRCHFKDQIYFNISGIEFENADKYIDKKIEIKINSIVSSILGYGTIIKIIEDDTIISGQLVTLKKSVENSLKDSIEKNKELSLYVDDPFDNNKKSNTYNMILGPNGRYVGVKEFLRRIKDGCSNCTEDMSIAKAHTISWDDCGNPYCPDCASFYNIM